MSHRCINPFEFSGRVYPSGVEVADDDPILDTHRSHFAEVEVAPRFGETATAVPGDQRVATPAPPAKKAAPKKAAGKSAPTVPPAEDGKNA